MLDRNEIIHYEVEYSIFRSRSSSCMMSKSHCRRTETELCLSLSIIDCHMSE